MTSGTRTRKVRTLLRSFAVEEQEWLDIIQHLLTQDVRVREGWHGGRAAASFAGGVTSARMSCTPVRATNTLCSAPFFSCA